MKGVGWVAVAFLFAGVSAAQDSVYVRVIDVGQGHAAVARLPGDHFFVFDAGHPSGGGSSAFDGIRSVIPPGEDIDLLVLSHSDSDHLGAVKRIADAYRVRRIVHGGLERTQLSAWRRAMAGISQEREAGAIEVNLKHDEVLPGSTLRVGDAFITIVSGFYAPPDDWEISGGPESGEFRNAGSIVARLLYAGRSVLFTGDAIGRHIGSPTDAVIAAEKYMIGNSPAVTVDADVLIAAHHGGDNGSSSAFIEAVSPIWVVFPAGRGYEHPWASTVQRFLDAGVAPDHLFRTDRGDREGGEEWSDSTATIGDATRDDDVEIVLRSDGSVTVRYREE